MTSGPAADRRALPSPAAGTGPRQERLALPPRPESVGAARHFLTTHLRDWGVREEAAVVELAASEVVTNAVVHARTPFELTLVAEDDVTVTVRDTAGSFPRRRWPHEGDVMPDGDSEGGRGLALVRAVTDDCGVDVDHRGSTVWFRVRLPQP